MNAANIVEANAPGARRTQWALSAMFWLLPVFAVGGGLAIAPLMTATGLAAVRPRPPAFGRAAALACLALALWAAAAAFWSPLDGWEQAGKLAASVLVGLLLVFAAGDAPVARRPFLRAAMLASMVALVVLLGVEALFDMPFNRAAQPDAATGLLLRNPGRGVLVLEVFGFLGLAAAMMSRNTIVRFGMSAALLLAMAFLSVQFDMSANAAALAIGLGAFALAWVAPRLGLLLTGGITALWLLIAPWLVLALKSPIITASQEGPKSWGQRLEIWSYAADRIAEKPWFGWGFDSSPSFDAERSFRGFEYRAIPLHPHNFSLQVWLELGLVGALLLAIAIALTTRAAMRSLGSSRYGAAAACGAIASLWFAWNVSYGAWQEWLVAMPFMIAASALMLRGAESPRTP